MKYLNDTGLAYFFNKLKTLFFGKLEEQIPTQTTIIDENGTLTNAIDMEIVEDTIMGKTEQTTYEGKNLWSHPNTSYSGESSTWRDISGHVAYGSDIANCQGVTLPAGTYTISVGELQNINTPVQLVNSSETVIYANNVSDTESKTFTLAKETFVIVRARNTNTNESAIKNIQIEQGSTATSYEPYVGGIPSPNPDYPQDIHVVTGECNVKVENKNLFDKNINTFTAPKYLITGETSTDGTWKATEGFISVKPNTVYTLSGYTPNSWAFYVVYFDINENFISRLQTDINGSSMQFTTLPNTYFIKLMGAISIIGNTDNFTLEEGSYTEHQEQNYPLSLGNIELCKIGDYKDSIYKNYENGKWYLHKEIEKSVFDGSENWSVNKAETTFMRYALSIPDIFTVTNNLTDTNKYVKSNYFYESSPAETINDNVDADRICAVSNNRIVVKTINSNLLSLNDFKTWLSTHNTTVYYVLATPTDTEITDTTLINQLEALLKAKTYKNVTNIILTGADLAPRLQLTYRQDINTKQDTLTAGHNININNNVISTKVKCFEWDGQSSTANPNNIALWQEIVNSTADGSNVLVVGKSLTNNDNTYRFVIVLNSLSFNSGNSKTFVGLVSHFWSANHAQDTQLSINRPKVTITFTNSTDKIVSSVGSLASESSSIRYLPLTGSSVTNYTPTYDYHPATKKYVDDSKTTVTDNLTSTSTTEALSANQGKVLNDTKVDKVTGKGLSTNDFTTTEQTKLAGIETGAEVNKINKIKVNGTEQTITNKTVDLNVSGSVSPTDLLNYIYPVGSIYMSVNSTSPASFLGGTWTRIQDKFLLAAGSSYSNGSTGGSATHTLTTSEMPSHTHTFTGTSHSHTYKQVSSTTEEHTLTINEIPAHYHNIKRNKTGATGSAQGIGIAYNSSSYDSTITSQTVGGGLGHSHSISSTDTTISATAGGTNSNTGGGNSFNTMPPYLAVYVWKRTA